MKSYNPDCAFLERLDFLEFSIFEITLVNEPWDNCLSDDPDEHKRLMKAMIQSNQKAYYQSILAENRKNFPPWWIGLKNVWVRCKQILRL